MNKYLVRLIAVLLTLALVSNPSFAAGFAGAPASPFSIPSKFGSITDFYQSPVRRTAVRSSQPMVVLIQDLHANSGVQRNIAEILKFLSKHSALHSQSSVFPVFVEGATGPFDVSFLRNIQDKGIKKELIKHFLDEAKLSGSEVAAIESATPLHLWGIDDKNLYIRNLFAFVAALKKSPAPHPANPAWNNYYQIAQERNVPLSLNTFNHIDLLSHTATPPAMVAVVLGGYHSEGITRLLKTQKMSYAVITPMVDRLGEERLYTQRMREAAQDFSRKTLSLLLRTSIKPFAPSLSKEFQQEVRAEETQLETPTATHSYSRFTFFSFWRKLIPNFGAFLPHYLLNFLVMGEGEEGGSSLPGAVIHPSLLSRVGDLFGDKTVNGKNINVERAIAQITRTIRPLIAVALASRRAFLNSKTNTREKYAFPSWQKKFKDADGNDLRFGDIVQGMIDNFLGVESKVAWRLNDTVAIPKDAFPLSNAGLEITGPKALDMLINQINAAPEVSSMMPDDEDASLSWQNLESALETLPPAFQGLLNLKAILAGEYDKEPYVTVKKGKRREYAIQTPKGSRPSVFSRAPGIHLKSSHVLVDGETAPQIVLSYVIHALNNHGSLTKSGSGLYHYQPKTQTPEEALIIEMLIRGVEQLAGLEMGSIKIKALYEEGRAGLTLPAIMWVWRHRLIGTNVGRWDYLGSLLEMWKDEVVFPDPQSIGMTDSRLMAYQRVNALWNLMAGVNKEGKLTNGAPIGGMAAVMLYPKNDPYGRARWNPKALRQMKLDKLRERLIGLIFVPNEPLVDGLLQPTLAEALVLESRGRGRFYDTYRQSWVATPDKAYVEAGALPMRVALSELHALIEAPVEMVTIEGTNQQVATVASGLTETERQSLQKLGLLNKNGDITPWVVQKNKINTPEKLFSASFWGGKDLWTNLYEPPAMNKPGENDPAKGHITPERIQNAFYQAAQYGFQILNNSYAAAVDDYEAWPGDSATGYRRFMNDLATYRIYAVFLWTVFHHQAEITKDGWLKAPLLTENGVIPGKNVVHLKAGTKMTPEIFQQVWDLHNQWTQAFFADFDRMAAERIAHSDKTKVTQVAEILSKAYAKGPFVQLSKEEAALKIADVLGRSNILTKISAQIAEEAPSFDRSQASVIMEVLKRQFLSNEYLQHNPRVLFVLTETPEAERAQILEAIFSPDRKTVIGKVLLDKWPLKTLKTYDDVHDVFINRPLRVPAEQIHHHQIRVTSPEFDGYLQGDRLGALLREYNIEYPGLFSKDAQPDSYTLAENVLLFINGEPITTLDPNYPLNETDSVQIILSVGGGTSAELGSEPKVDDHRLVSVTVRLPYWLQKKLGVKFNANAYSQFDAVEKIVAHDPRLGHHLYKNGALRADLRIFVNGVDQTASSVRLKPNDKITLNIPEPIPQITVHIPAGLTGDREHDVKVQGFDISQVREHLKKFDEVRRTLYTSEAPGSSFIFADETGMQISELTTLRDDEQIFIVPAVQVRIPTGFLDLTQKQKSVQAFGNTPLAVLEDLSRRYPKLSPKLLTPEGEPKVFISLFDNFVEKDHFTQPFTTEAPVIALIPTVAGGHDGSVVPVGKPALVTIILPANWQQKNGGKLPESIHVQAATIAEALKGNPELRALLLNEEDKLHPHFTVALGRHMHYEMIDRKEFASTLLLDDDELNIFPSVGGGNIDDHIPARSVSIRIPTAYRDDVDGKRTIYVPAARLVDILIHLVLLYPETKKHFFEPEGELKGNLIVSVNGKAVHAIEHATMPLATDDVVEIPEPIALGIEDGKTSPMDSGDTHSPIGLPAELKAEVAARRPPAGLKERADAIRKDWAENPRWKGIKRSYTAEDVVTIQGFKNIVYTHSDNGSRNVWNIQTLLSHVLTFGITRGIKAQSLVRAGFWILYDGGWNAAAMTNTSHTQYSDQSTYSWDTQVEIVKDLNGFMEALDTMNPEKHFGKRAAKPSWWLGSKWIIPIVTDIEAGFGGILNVFHAIVALIKAGIAAAHLEDQNALWKKCGHMLGKVLDPTSFVIQKFIAMRFAADVMGVPLFIIGRTDADAARVITSDADPYDRQIMVRHEIRAGQFFNDHLIKEDEDAYLYTEEDGRLLLLLSDRNAITKADAQGRVYVEENGNLSTLQFEKKDILLLDGNRVGLNQTPGFLIVPEKTWKPQKGLTPFRMTHNGRLRDEFGMWVKKVGTDAAIHRGLAYAPHVDELWFETKSPDLVEAQKFADAIHAKYPGKLLAYNLSGNFNWVKFFKTAEEAQAFSDALGKMGYKFQFNTTGEFWLEAALTLIYGIMFKKYGMKAFYKLQKFVQKAEKIFDFEFLPQEWSTVKVQDKITETVTGATHLSALGDSRTGATATEAQFGDPGHPKDSGVVKPHTDSSLANLITGRGAWFLNTILRILFVGGIVPHEIGHFGVAFLGGRWDALDKVGLSHFFYGMPFESNEETALAGLTGNIVAVVGAFTTYLATPSGMLHGIAAYFIVANLLTFAVEFAMFIPSLRKSHPNADMIKGLGQSRELSAA